MPLANVALTDTFDYWRTVTNSMVFALNDKLFYANTSNANTVFIPSYVSRTSNLYINIITTSAINDTSTSNIPSTLAVNTVYNYALTYAASGNSWSNTVGASSNLWSNAVGTAGNNYTNTVGTAGNNYTNFVGTSGNNYTIAVGAAANSNASVLYATKISPTFTGTITLNANVANQILTDGVTINWDVSSGSVATVTLGGNRTIAAPTNLKVGTYVLHVIQDAVGSRTLSWNAVFKWPAGVAPVLTTTANRRDLFSFVCDGTNLYGSYLPDVR